LDFSASVNPFGPPPGIFAAIQAQLEGLRTYPDPEYQQLRNALGEFCGVEPSWVLPGNGAAELLTWACRDLARSCPMTQVLTPSFKDYDRALRSFGASIQRLPLPLIPAPPDLDLLFSPYPQDQGLLLNNPHNPTGLLFSRDFIRSRLEAGGLVVVDEAFMDFVVPEARQSVMEWVQDFKNLVVICSLTKFYSLPGLRLGYAVAHPDRLQRWQAWRDPWPVNHLAVAAGIAAVQEKAFQDQTLAWLQSARIQLWQGLQQLPGLTPWPSAANFLLVHSQASVPPLQLALLQRFQILIRDCLSFPELGDRFFRVAVRTEAENQRLLQALAVVLSEL
jgi:L-threonine-O-3-phosphate decarboxylase